MKPDTLDCLKTALALLKEESSHDPSRELSIAITQLETAILWYKHDISLKDTARS